MGPLLLRLHTPDSCLLPAPRNAQGNLQSHSLRQHVHALPQACRDGSTERYSWACLYAGLQRLQDFVQWVTRYLVGCLYPEAPSSRKYLAMQLLNTVLDVWQTPNGSTKFYQRPEDTVLEGDGALRIGQHSFAPFHLGFFGPDLTQKLLGEACSRLWTSLSRGLQIFCLGYCGPETTLALLGEQQRCLPFCSGFIRLETSQVSLCETCLAG